MEPAKISRLPNGFTIVTHKHPTAEQTFVGVGVSVGSRHEEKGEDGNAHFLEHMVLKDTKYFNKQQRQDHIDNMYGYGNAYTTTDGTLYYYYVNNGYVKPAIELLKASLRHATMSSESVETEKGVIKSEKQGMESAPNAAANKLFNEVAYPDFRPVIGSHNGIKSTTLESLETFKGKHYSPERMILTVVGNVEHENICETAREAFGDMTRGTERKDVGFPRLRYRGGYAAVENSSYDDIAFRMAHPVGGYEKGMREYAKNVLLADLLGAQGNSPLYRSLRLESGIAYSPSSGVNSEKDVGEIIVSANFVSQNAQEAVRRITKEVRGLAETINEKDLARLKKSWIGLRERQNNEPATKAQMLYRQMLCFGREISSEEFKAILDSISLDELKKDARAIFSRPPTVVAQGKGVDRIPSYEEITTALGHPMKIGRDGTPFPVSSPGPSRSSHSGSRVPEAKKTQHAATKSTQPLSWKELALLAEEIGKGMAADPRIPEKLRDDARMIADLIQQQASREHDPRKDAEQKRTSPRSVVVR